MPTYSLVVRCVDAGDDQVADDRVFELAQRFGKELGAHIVSVNELDIRTGQTTPIGCATL